VSEIQGGRWDTGLRRLFNIKGPSVAPSLGPEIQPITIAQPWVAENEYLLRNRLCVGYGNKAATVGEYSAVQLENPAGSNTILVVSQVWHLASGAGSFFINMLAGAHTLSVSNGAKAIDTRWKGYDGPSIDESVGQVWSGSTVAVQGSTIVAYRTTANATARMLVDFVLDPGGCLLVTASAVNVGVDGVSFWWRERSIEPSET